jgi:hypothetical protein
MQGVALQVQGQQCTQDLCLLCVTLCCVGNVCCISNDDLCRYSSVHVSFLCLSYAGCCIICA